MKKNIVLMIIILVLIIFTSSIALAENDTNSTNSEGEKTFETNDKEIGVFKEQLGAHIRMGQLVKQLSKNIYFGSEVINYLDSNETIARANAITSEMTVLIENIEAYNYSYKKAEELAEEYIVLKELAKDLTKDFRELTKTEITNNETKLIRESLKDIEKNELKEINEKVKNMIREHNAERAKQAFERLGAKNDELIEQIREGAAKREELKTELKTKLSELGEEAKGIAEYKIREEQKERKEHAEKVREKQKKKQKKCTNEKKMQLKTG